MWFLCFNFELLKTHKIKKMNTNELKLPMDEFIVRAHEYIPATYGKMICKKICYDSKSKMKEISSYEEMGDTIIQKSYYEVKVSFLNRSKRFSIKNIRTWQSFDYFILCLVDTTDFKYKAFYYCVPKSTIVNSPVLVLSAQNTTKISNEENKNVAMGTTVDLDDHAWLFKKDNVLKGNSYKDLLEYITKKGSSCELTKTIPKQVNYFQPRRPIQKIFLKMGKIILDGNSNREVMVKLVRHIGPSKLDGIIWSTWLCKYGSAERNVSVGEGYFFNSKFSIRDLTTTVNQINKKLNLSFKIINK